MRHNIGRRLIIPTKAAHHLDDHENQQGQRRNRAGNHREQPAVALLFFLAALLFHLALGFTGRRSDFRRSNRLGGVFVGLFLQVQTDIVHIHIGILAEFLQILQHLVGRCVALGDVGTHRLHTDQFQRLGNIFIDITRCQRHSTQVLDRHRNCTVTFKRQTSRQHLIQHHTGGIDVGSGIHTVAARLFGGNIMHAAQRFLRQRISGIGKAGNTEIGNFYTAIPQDHNVLRLDVAVNNATAMGVVQTADDLRDKMQRFAPVHLTAALHILLQRNAFQQFHYDIFQFPLTGNIINGHNICVGQLRYRLRFIAETAAEISAVCQITLEDLHCNHTVQTVALCLVDICHTAAADQLKDLISLVQHFSNILIHI